MAAWEYLGGGQLLGLGGKGTSCLCAVTLRSSLERYLSFGWKDCRVPGSPGLSTQLLYLLPGPATMKRTAGPLRVCTSPLTNS